MRLRKEQRAREDFEKMKAAASMAGTNLIQAKQTKQNQFQSSLSSLKGTIKADESFAANDRDDTLRGKSTSSMGDSFNNRTMQYTERSTF
jgi:hypothetical protein